VRVGKGRLMGTAEIADRLGVTRQRAYQISRTKTFPDSFDDVSAGSFWLSSDVEKWIAENRAKLVDDIETDS
jgi:prophage regulatory protein